MKRSFIITLAMIAAIAAPLCASVGWSRGLGVLGLGGGASVVPSSEPITYESISSGAVAATSSTSFTITKPTGVVSGDTLVAVIGKTYNRSFVSSGWSTVGGTDKLSQFLIKTAGESEPDNYEFASSGDLTTTGGQGVIIRISGTIGSYGTTEDTSNSTYDTTVDYAAPTITSNNSFVIWSGVRSTLGDTKTLSSISRGVIRHNNTLAGGARYAFWVATEDAVSAGSPIVAATSTMSSAGNGKYGRALWISP